jgi:hypothetical protein
MAFIFTFDFVIEMLAAFVIFVIGYLALFISLMVCLALIKGIYEGAKRVRAYAVRSASPNRPISSDADGRALIANR